MSIPRIPAVLTVTLNPALDHTIEVDSLALGEVNRALSMQVDVGGKGINVASCLADFGVATGVTGQLGRDNVALFEALFAAKRIDNRFAYLDGLTRINTKLVDRRSRQTTDINMPGPTFDAGGAEALLGQIELEIATLMPACRWVVLAGSLPPGLPADSYARMARTARRHGARVVLDASGAALRAAIAAGVTIAKPNRAELSELVGEPLPTPGAVLQAARALIAAEHGPQQVVVSMGGDGALFVTAHEALHAHPADITPLSTVGAGDAMVAGIVAGAIETLPLAEQAQLATAFSAAKLARLGPHLPSAGAVRELARSIRITAAR
ncbi:1-phosphofructokinase [Niveibacterium umoris]|uniref:Phosphofructokinase n=1 Tax=Niveibacterium umoris TaxID=1193620 RepID=A0A840BWD9_9RHOO|nr:1-phosphofructokinase [Niveibacterium umoris]MBB4014627.1 1-phosphofructokinase [Niveibacterium umoris]